MDPDTAESLRRLALRVDEAELRCKIVAYALRGAVSQLNPNAKVAARRMANTAVLANCPDGDRAKRLAILVDLFPDARDRTEDKGFIPSP